MTKTKIWLSPPHIGFNEERYVKRAFDSNWIAPKGPNIDLFEKELEDCLDNNVHVAVLINGTAAIHIALDLLGVSAGDEVICQSFTFCASANPISYLGATPVFVDSERDTWNISPLLLEKAILDRIARGNKPKAIVAVHLYGMPYKVNEITEIANRYDIPIVEDSAEALGSKYQGISCGSLGDLGILSFNGNKIITTSAGGALVTNNKDLRNRAIYLATQANDSTPYYQHSHIGYNYRMSNVLAGVGCGQITLLEDRVAARRANFNFYKRSLENLPGIEFLTEPKGFFSNRWLTCFLTPSQEAREKIRKALLEDDIEARPLMKPLHQQPVFKHCPNYVDGTSADLFERGLCLPSGSNLKEEDLERIVGLIHKTEL